MLLAWACYVHELSYSQMKGDCSSFEAEQAKLICFMLKLLYLCSKDAQLHLQFDRFGTLDMSFNCFFRSICIAMRLYIHKCNQPVWPMGHGVAQHICFDWTPFAWVGRQMGNLIRLRQAHARVPNKVTRIIITIMMLLIKEKYIQKT